MHLALPSTNPIPWFGKMGYLLTLCSIENNKLYQLQYMVSFQEGRGNGAFAHEAANLINFNLANANPVSIITQKVSTPMPKISILSQSYGYYMLTSLSDCREMQISESEQVLWTSTIGNVLVYREQPGKGTLELLASLKHGFNFRFHGESMRAMQLQRVFQTLSIAHVCLRFPTIRLVCLCWHSRDLYWLFHHR